ncbi:periplasmic component of amino acid ABC-type transporter/signal transduction system [Herbaspirillum sp. CF444]|uniref:ABC transporter substrate-binding protein n=1 Tax=Herbaspirillum sp. CF444 TaxID=1144319 RepID=UPI00027251F5|nr:ABC transporter substrate-binding protein [Herbaspirillum sp. CF444]EJL86758.1 periplasmic component of amino acid ABC-type transporter/signal transduction system [Herbaspirillum sp. CF444]
MKLNRLLSGLLLSCIAALTLQARADQLQEVNARKELICGVYADVVPFSYPDQKTRALVGMDVDLCNALAKEMGLKPTLKPLSVEARISEVKMGRVDLVIANLAYTKTRGEQIEFSNAYYITKEVLLVKKADAAKTLTDFEGKRISATKGSTSEQSIHLAVKNGVPVTFQDTGSAYLALQQNKVSGFVTNMMTAIQFVQQTKGSPDELAILREPMVLEPIGAGMRKGEPAFAAAVNKALMGLEASGEFKKIWDKWLGPDTKYGITRTEKIAPLSELKFQPLQ